MKVAHTAAPASFIVERLTTFAENVGSIIPLGFDAYARIHHPLARHDARGELVPVMWQDISRAHGQTIDELMRTLDHMAMPSAVGPSDQELFSHGPSHGSLPYELAECLVEVLGAHTRSPEQCWFAYWDGYGDFHRRVPHAPTFSVPNRRYLLFEGTLLDAPVAPEALGPFYQSANLWWPHDRSWCVATEIDFTWTYVGGSTRCIQQLIADPRIEAFPVTTETYR